jgi:hypothetical protein
MHMCPIPNGFRGRAFSLYSSIIFDKKEILRTTPNAGIYCSSCFSTPIHFASRVKAWRVTRLYSVQKSFGIEHVYIYFCSTATGHKPNCS